MIVTAIVLGVIAAIIDWWIGIKDPWRMIIYVGIVVLLIFGIGAVLIRTLAAGN